MINFITSNASAVFALLGALLGAIVTGFINYLLNTKETKLRIVEKVLDKKIEAHESLVDIVNKIRSMVLLGGTDGTGQLIRCPVILQNRQSMDDFLSEFSAVRIKADRWLSAPVLREINLFMDYFANIYEGARNWSNVELQEVGVFIKNDFTTFAQRIEKQAHAFFDNDLMKLNPQTDRSWHKYDQTRTHEELEQTEFFSQREIIMEIVNAHTEQSAPADG